MFGIKTVALACLLASANVVLAQSEIANAAMQQNTAELERLLKAGADVNGSQADGATALHWAAYHGDAALVGQLLKAGANPAVANRNGSTPMWLAANRGDAAVIEALLDTFAAQRLPAETFINTVRRIGLEPFKTAANAMRMSTGASNRTETSSLASV
jgi:ankyrin repeat protein